MAVITCAIARLVSPSRDLPGQGIVVSGIGDCQQSVVLSREAANQLRAAACLRQPRPNATALLDSTQRLYDLWQTFITQNGWRQEPPVLLQHLHGSSVATELRSFQSCTRHDP